MADPYASTVDDLFGGGLVPVQAGGAGARRAPPPTYVPIPEFGGQPRPRPRRQAQPRQEAPQPAPPPAADPVAPPPQTVDDLFKVPTAPAAAPAPANPNAEPDAPTWWGRRQQDISGKQDPRFKGLPTLADTGAVLISDVNRSQLTMPNDASYADMLTKSLAPGVTMTRRFKDANDYEVVGFKYDDGPEQLAYVNQPGLDTSDVGRGVMGALPFLFGGGIAAKGLQKVGAPLAAKVFGQAGTAGVVSLGQDAAAYGQGSEQGVDLPKLAGSVAGGAIGELAAPVIGGLWRKFVTEPRLFNKATGELTEKGAEAARASGIDPAELTSEIQQEFAKLLARSGNARAAGVAAETGDLNIPTTLGQRTKNVAQLTREQEMRDGVWGQSAAKAMKDFDEKQWQAIVNATMGEIAPNKPGMSIALNPNRSPGDYAPGQLGTSIAERTQAGRQVMEETASETWKAIGKIEPTDGALAELPRYIGNALGDLAPTENDVALMPVTTSILKQAKSFIEKSPPKQAVDEFLPTTPVADVNRFRQAIGAKIGEMEKGTDRNAAGKVYNAVNDWIREMAEQNMLTATTGDASVAAARMVTARGLTRNLHELVEASGNKPGAAIVKKILDGADSPEEVIRSLFVGPTAKSVKPGSIAAIKSIKEFAAQLPKEDGDMLMKDLKLAYWLQIVRNPAGKEGENIYNPQTLLRNLRVSSDSQRSVWLSMFTPQELAFRNRLIRALENGPTFHDWTVKPNSSRSGTTAGRMVMEALGSLVGGNWAKTISSVGSRASGITATSVNKATSQQLPAVNPYLIGPYGAAGGSSAGRGNE